MTVHVPLPARAGRAWTSAAAAACRSLPSVPTCKHQSFPGKELWQRLQPHFTAPQFPSRGGAGTPGAHTSLSEASANPQIKPRPAPGSGQGVKRVAVEPETFPAVTPRPCRGWSEEDK